MSFNYSPKIVTDGLVLYLDAANSTSYPSSGNTWYDISKNEYVGTLTNTPSFDSQNFGSILFDGINEYVDFGTSGESAIRTTNEITINVFCKCTGYSNPSGGISWAPLSCIDRYNLGNSYRKFSFYLLKDDNVSTESIVCEFFDGSGNTTSVSNIMTILNGTFMITVTVDSSNTNLYVNGEIVDSQSGIVLNSNPLTSDFTIGSRINTSYNGHFKGNIFNFSFYNRALSISEVQKNYNATKTRHGL